ncbi:hypothetical protein D3C81_2097150 [compost metagenome]
MQPVKSDFFDFDPAITHRLQAALLECLAVAVTVEQGETAMQRAWCEQRDQIAHGEVPFGFLKKIISASRYVQV